MPQPIEHLVRLAVFLYSIMLTSSYCQSIMMIRSDIMMIIGWRECFVPNVMAIVSFFNSRIIATMTSWKHKTTSHLDLPEPNWPPIKTSAFTSLLFFTFSQI